MLPFIFINCAAAPFIDDIIDGRKTYETRTRDTLRQFVGRRVLLAETGNGRPVVRCSAVITCAVPVDDRATWRKMRRSTRVPSGSRYDWQPGTRRKWLYGLSGVVACWPFVAPEGVRHGRVWMEYNNDGGALQ